ncbi:MAG: hypothetical protein M4579_001813 [Chaenotheca gracillima]|nr:MAG: hypothetical protein M4579_001813 [Chaenotheca gracillima]
MGAPDSDREQPSRRSELEDEITHLNARLDSLRNELSELSPSNGPGSNPRGPALISSPTPSHALLLLSDTALPLGSFAYSHGLESYLAHHPKSRKISNGAPTSSFPHFLHLSLSSTASLSIPHLLAAFHDPAALESHAQTYDASVPCAVMRRASLAQGRALLAVWERSFRPALPPSTNGDHGAPGAIKAVDAFATALKAASGTSSTTEAYDQPQPHYPSVYGAVCRALQLTSDQAASVFLLSHVRSVLSAAVRASVLGPYAAQAVLASPEIERALRTAVSRNVDVDVEEASQGAPVMDLWAGRHEMLYSRIFNS